MLSRMWEEERPWLPSFFVASATIERLFLRLYARDATENLSKKKMSAILLTRTIARAIELNFSFAVSNQYDRLLLE